MKFLILHGTYGSPEINWFPWLKQSLESLSFDVKVPQLPVENYEEVQKILKSGNQFIPKNQTLENWFDYYNENLSEWVGSDSDTVVVGHSSAPVFVLHLIEKLNARFDSAIFVSPFFEKLGLPDAYEVVNNDFYYSDFDFKQIREVLPLSYAIFSDNDPYMNIKYPRNFAEQVGSIPIVLKGGEHLGGVIKEFPLVLELCKGSYNYLSGSK